MYPGEVIGAEWLGVGGRPVVDVDSVYITRPRDCSARLKSREALLNGELADFESTDTLPCPRATPLSTPSFGPPVNGAWDAPRAGVPLIEILG